MSLTFWGLSSLSFVYAKGYPALLALRCGFAVSNPRRTLNNFMHGHSVLLGIGEAGYYAGMVYYLSFWCVMRRVYRGF